MPIGTTSKRISNAFQSLRLIRLIRIVKLYQYFVKSSAEEVEAKLRAQQKTARNAVL